MTPTIPSQLSPPTAITNHIISNVTFPSLDTNQRDSPPQPPSTTTATANSTPWIESHSPSGAIFVTIFSTVICILLVILIILLLWSLVRHSTPDTESPVHLESAAKQYETHSDTDYVYSFKSLPDSISQYSVGYRTEIAMFPSVSIGNLRAYSYAMQWGWECQHGASDTALARSKRRGC